MRDLRRTLASIVLAAPLLGCMNQDCPKPKQIDDLLFFDETDMELQPLIADCEGQQSCEPLCRELYERAHGVELLGKLETCELVNEPEGLVAMHVLSQQFQVCGGRRPGNYRRGVSADTCNAVASYLAHQADLEAASGRAFADLYADLVALGAPAEMRRAAIRAAADEVRHAATCAALARRFGATVRLRQVRAATRRDLHALVVENTVEGCIRETYGAAVAGYQARTARDPLVRRAMYRIARDEAKHALLAWKIQRWAAPKLADRSAILAAAANARAELAAEAVTVQPEVHGTLGIPAPAAATAMLGELDARVWSPLAWRS